MIPQTFRRSLLCFIVLTIAACSTSFEVVNSTAISGTEVSEESRVVTYHGSYWGELWESANRFPADENWHGIHKVEAQSNLLDSLAAVLTLGIWAPVTVEYWGYEKVEDDDPDIDTDLPSENDEDDQ